MENLIAIEAKTSGNNRSRRVPYAFVESFHSTCIEKKEVILSQIFACERLKKFTKDDTDQIILEKEIFDLKLILDLIE
mgnify:FL=1